MSHAPFLALITPLSSPGVPTHPIELPPNVPAHPIVIPPDAIAPGVPTHPIYLPPPIPSHPIVIPPDAISPGVPTHPIVLPPYYPAHPIIIPPDAISPGVPAHPIYIPDPCPPGIWGGGNEPFPTPPIAGIPGLPGYEPPRPPHIWGGGNEPFPTPPIVVPPINWKPPEGVTPPDPGEVVPIGGQSPTNPIVVPEFVLINYPGYGWVAVGKPVPPEGAPVTPPGPPQKK